MSSRHQFHPTPQTLRGRPLRRTDLPLRPVALGQLGIHIEVCSSGVIYAHSPAALPTYDASVTARLDRWAKLAPRRAFLLERNGDGWRTLTFAEARQGARAIAQALLDRGLSAQRPLVILSGNSVAHALLALGALYVGIPYVPVSPAYSLLSQDFLKLKRILARVSPGLVFAEEQQSFAKAVAASVPADVEIASCAASCGERRSTDFAELLAAPPTAAVDGAHAAVRPDMIAKILFTSGSLGVPKGVITTHRMLCANQAMIAYALPFLNEEPPVLVDWLPWHHSFGGNHNFGIALHHGGTLYIDEGRPTDVGITETVRSLREVSPTVVFNVPKGFEMLLPHLAADRALAASFFRRLRLNFFAGATLAPRVAAALDEIAHASCGERVRMISGFGATETAPSVLFQTDPVDKRADLSLAPVGLPLPGNELKLVPVGAKYEARVRGPNVMPRYWADEERTRLAFDEEGFLTLGDFLRLADETRPGRGFLFEGRIGEDFKLSSGATVSSGSVRASVLAAAAPFVRDVVIAGENRDRLAALVFPDFGACRGLAADLRPDAEPAEILVHPTVQAWFREVFADLAGKARGSSQRIAIVALLTDAASLDRGEITDKGSLNQKLVLERRAALVEALYADEEQPLFIRLSDNP